MSDVYPKIAERIRSLRKRAGLTQAQLGERSGGINAQEISRFESCSRVPSIETLARVASGLGVTLAELTAIGEDEANAEAERVRALLNGESSATLRLVGDLIELLKRHPNAAPRPRGELGVVDGLAIGDSANRIDELDLPES